MKPRFTIVVLATASLLWFFPISVEADDFESTEYVELLAKEIAASSGYPEENYRSYANQLATTLSLLTPQQRNRVFEGGDGGEAGSGFSLLDLLQKIIDALT